MALSRGDFDLTSWALDTQGAGAWSCLDDRGKTPLDVASSEVDNQTARLLEWARAQQAKQSNNLESLDRGTNPVETE